jgi:photosystem II stability/assembly factor-like uncharacterized protein
MARGLGNRRARCAGDPAAPVGPVLVTAGVALIALLAAAPPAAAQPIDLCLNAASTGVIDQPGGGGSINTTGGTTNPGDQFTFTVDANAGNSRVEVNENGNLTVVLPVGVSGPRVGNYTAVGGSATILTDVFTPGSAPAEVTVSCIPGPPAPPGGPINNNINIPDVGGFGNLLNNAIGPPDMKLRNVPGMADFFALDPGFTGGVFVAAGDVNGDGRDDIIVGNDLPPRVGIFDRPNVLGGGNPLIIPPPGPEGGGLFDSGGSFTITNSTISGNTPSGGGGGILEPGRGTLVIENITISSGSPPTPAGGGGIPVPRSDSLTILDNTISANTAIELVRRPPPILDLVVDPDNPNVIYLGDRRSGTVHRTGDGGRNWVPLDPIPATDPDNPIINVTTPPLDRADRSDLSVVSDPLNPNVIYVLDRTLGRFHRTADAGQNFEIIESIPATDPGSPLRLDILSPTDNSAPGDVIHYTRGDTGGIWRMGSDGQTWQQLPATGPPAFPTDPDALFITPSPAGGGPGDTIHTSGAAGGGIWRTTDGGRNWVQLQNTDRTLISPGGNPLAVAPASDTDVPGHVLYSSTGSDGGIWKSTDGGRTWEQLQDTGRTESAPDPNALGTSLSQGGGAPDNFLYSPAAPGAGVWRSSDGGLNWHQLQDSAGTPIPAGPIRPLVTLTSDSGPGSLRQGISGLGGDRASIDGLAIYLYDTTSGRIRTSRDGGRTWHALDTDGDGTLDLAPVEGGGARGPGPGTITITSDGDDNLRIVPPEGGGLFRPGGGTVTITNSTISGNVARFRGAEEPAGSGAFNLNLTSDQLLAELGRRRRAATHEALRDIRGLAAADALITAYEPPLDPAPLWHFWLDGRVGERRQGPDAARIRSDIEQVTAGAYYTNFSNASTTGGYFAFRGIDGDIPGELGLDGEAWGAAVFHTRPIGERLLGKLLTFFEVGDADTTIGAATGSFDFTTWQIEGEIAGHHDFGSWWLRPRVNLFYTVTDRDGFVLSDGTAIPGGDTDTLRLSFGPTVGHRYWHPEHATMFTPFAAIEGEWDIVDGPDGLSPSGTLISNDPFNFRLTGGVNIANAAATGTLKASYVGGGGGDDEQAEFRGTLNIPLN